MTISEDIVRCLGYWTAIGVETPCLLPDDSRNHAKIVVNVNISTSAAAKSSVCRMQETVVHAPMSSGSDVTFIQKIEND